MKFPFILRSDHEFAVSQLEKIIALKDEKIEELDRYIIFKEKEIGALLHNLTSPQSPLGPEVVKEKKKFAPSRLSYRSLSQKRSQDTIRPPADSALALEDKVKKEGGTV